jgi:antitoxin component of MazEF toxin-antitoxin module
MDQTVFKSGGSLVVSIPSSFTEIAGIKSGDPVSVKTNYEKGTITYSFSGAKQLILRVAETSKKTTIK